MAVEARHFNLFQSQLIQDRKLLIPINQGNAGSAYNSKEMRFLGIPSAAVLPENQSFCQPEVCGSVQAKTMVNTESGLTYNIYAPRKRSRDCINQLHAAPDSHTMQKNNRIIQLPSFAGEDIWPKIDQYQFEIDAIISQQTKKIRLELEERQKQQARLLTAAIGEGAVRRLKEKDEQIQRINKMNLVLQERVKSLYVENQLWRDLAQTNEATANSLRNNLEQVLLQVGSEDRVSAGAGGGAAAVDDDVESCCGSSDNGRDAELGQAQDKEVGSSCPSDRRCKMCGERESCVLLLPCRHVCLCSVCGSGSHQLQSCPVCNSTMNATLHVNMSS